MEIPNELQDVPAAPPKTGGALEETEADSSAPRLLWVDDDASFLLGIGRSLRAQDREIKTLLLDNPVEALLEVSRFKPHLVVLEIDMPEVNAFEACRTLKQRQSTGPMAVVLVTEQGSEELRRKAEEVGADAYFDKPVDVDSVLQRLDAVLSSSERKTAAA